MQQPGPTLSISDELHATKYRGDGESFKESMNRIASALGDDTAHFREFREIILDMRFMPGGRIQAAMGSPKRVTPYNCFVSGTIEDSFVEGNGCIMERAKEAAATMRMGGGIGYDFSTLRPRGALIRKLNSKSSGPLAFMDIYDAICRCVASSGHRRGAQMGVLRIDHPDIEEFIHAKQNSDRLTGFNISIAVTDDFMECLESGRPFTLRFGHETYGEVDPAALWEKVMRSTWDWAEPGVIFIDTINRMNNLYYCERIAATNPCAEQPLPPHGACLLGSFNLVRYVRQTNGTAGERYFDWDLFTGDIPAVVRAMDNVVDKAVYPLYEQEKEAKNKRRMGLGVTGLANTIEALGHPYGSPEFLSMMAKILEKLTMHCYRASAQLASEKGSFPLYDEQRYLNGQFVLHLDEETRSMIQRYGIRNSHLTSIAPTGTISLCADNISGGIEPVFALKAKRKIRTFEGDREEDVVDYGSRIFKVKGKQSNEVTVDEHLSVLCLASQWVDSAVSKTCNVPANTPWADFKALYRKAWQSGAKGCTTFQIGGKRSGILNAEDESVLACTIDENGRKTCD